MFSSKPNDPNPTSLAQADRNSLVENLGDNVILPRYDPLNTAINNFDGEV